MKDNLIPFDLDPLLAAYKILNVIPDDYKPDIKRMIKRFQNRSEEQRPKCWLELNEFLCEILMDEQWKKDVIKAFRLED